MSNLSCFQGKKQLEVTKEGNISGRTPSGKKVLPRSLEKFTSKKVT